MPSAQKDLARQLDFMSPQTAFLTAKNQLRRRWPEAEPVILKSPHWAMAYAIDVIKGRWPEAEPTIASSIYDAREYAIQALRGRFELGEPKIMTQEFHGDDGPSRYVDMLKRSDPEGYEAFTLEHGDWAPDKVAEAALLKARCQS